MKKRTTRRALVLSLMSLLLCCSMLVGTTFAWFTDSVTSGKNRIVAGNLDVELYYKNATTSDWTQVGPDTNVFKTDTLWEPGHTEVVTLKVVNEGTLALKYQLGIHVAEEIGSVNKDGKEFKLSDHIKFAILDGEQTLTREKAVEEAEKNGATALNTAYKSGTQNLAAKNDGNTDEKTVTMVVYMPTTVDNTANYGKDQPVPEILLGLQLDATQDTVEADSFDEKYDEAATLPVEAWDKVTTIEPVLVDGSYAVGTPAELAWIAARTAKTLKFHLTADIDMLGVTVSSIDLESYHTVEGNGKTISNLVVEGSGLFGDCGADGNIRNLTLDNVTVNTASGDYAGIVAGKYSGKYTKVTVVNSAVNAPNSEYVGGLAGGYYKNLAGCKVENCSITGTEKVGGLVGFFTLADVGYSIKLSDCTATNVTVTATNTAKPYAGVIFGRGLATGSYKFIFENCSAGLKSGQKVLGQDYYNNIDISAITVTNLP